MRVINVFIRRIFALGTELDRNCTGTSTVPGTQPVLVLDTEP